jgi:hypothetical protein
LAVFGAPPELIEETKEKSVEQYEVDEENWSIVNTFLHMSSQWNFTEGFRTGLNYQSLDFYFRVHKIKNRKDVFDGLQIMEFSALECLNNKDK